MNIQPNSTTTVSWTAAKRIADDVAVIIWEHTGRPVLATAVLFRAASLYFPEQRTRAAADLAREHAGHGCGTAVLARALRTYGATAFETVNGGQR